MSETAGQVPLQKEESDARPSTASRRRRDKAQLSCNLCRFKKSVIRPVPCPSELQNNPMTRLRCDRQQPCSTCTGRGLARTCAYATDPTSYGAAIDYRPKGRVPDVQQRIQHLESLVRSLMAKGHPENTLLDSSTSLAAETLMSPTTIRAESDVAPTGDVPVDLGKMSLDDGATTYVSSSHWIAVLDNVRAGSGSASTKLIRVDCGTETMFR